MGKPDLEGECWSVYRSVPGEGLESIDRRLKALDLLVKIRSAGKKVKDAPDDDKRSSIDRIIETLNSKS